MLVAGALVNALSIAELQATPLLVAGGGLTLFSLRWISRDPD
jgi:hypothetical protein